LYFDYAFFIKTNATTIPVLPGFGDGMFVVMKIKVIKKSFALRLFETIAPIEPNDLLINEYLIFFKRTSN
jgi:hypothetical protein